MSSSASDHFGAASVELRPDGWQAVSGVVLAGHGVASGCGAETPYPEGSIHMQLPYFRERGLDLSGYFGGTLNLSIAPVSFRLKKPNFTFRQVHWTDLHPPEDFSFVEAQLEYGGQVFPAWVYHPHPETKKAHFQEASVIEVLAPRIEGVVCGSRLTLLTQPERLHLEQPREPTRQREE